MLHIFSIIFLFCSVDSVWGMLKSETTTENESKIILSGKPQQIDCILTTQNVHQVLDYLPQDIQNLIYSKKETNEFTDDFLAQILKQKEHEDTIKAACLIACATQCHCEDQLQQILYQVRYNEELEKVDVETAWNSFAQTEISTSNISWFDIPFAKALKMIIPFRNYGDLYTETEITEFKNYIGKAIADIKTTNCFKKTEKQFNQESCSKNFHEIKRKIYMEKLLRNSFLLTMCPMVLDWLVRTVFDYQFQGNTEWTVKLAGFVIEKKLLGLTILLPGMFFNIKNNFKPHIHDSSNPDATKDDWINIILYTSLFLYFNGKYYCPEMVSDYISTLISLKNKTVVSSSGWIPERRENVTFWKILNPDEKTWTYLDGEYKPFNFTNIQKR